MGKAHLKIRYHKKGLGLKKDCVMNMRELRHEYKRGCILKVTFLTTSLGVDLIYLFACPLSEAPMGSRH